MRQSSSFGLRFPTNRKRSKILLRMPRVSHEELLARLTKGKRIPALLLRGDEPFLRDPTRSQLTETFVPAPARAWAVSRYSANPSEPHDALPPAHTPPMLARPHT